MRDREQARRVIILDDEPSDRAWVAALLDEAGVPVEGTYAELFDLLDTLRSGEHPDLVVTDLNLPDSRGVATVRILRAAHPGLPIVVVTGDPDAAEGALAAGADEVVHKDRAQADLGTALERCFQRSEGPGDARAAAFYLADAPLVVVEADDEVVLMNAAADRLMGRPREREDTLTAHFIPEDRMEVARFLRDLRGAAGERVWATARVEVEGRMIECTLTGRAEVGTGRGHITVTPDPHSI